MLILSSTTDTIEVLLSASTTNPLECTAFYHDINTTSDEPKRTRTTTNGTTAVTIVPAPSVGFQRIVDSIIISNTNTSAVNLTIRYNDNGTFSRLLFVNLGIDESIQYSKQDGFKTYTNNGALKQTISAGTNPVDSTTNLVVLPADVSNTSGSYEPVTGLDFPFSAGNSYRFKATVNIVTTAATQGFAVSVRVLTGGVSNLSYWGVWPTAATTFSFNSNITPDSPASSGLSSPTSGPTRGCIEGEFSADVDGTFGIVYRGESTSACVALAGISWLEWQQL